MSLEPWFLKQGVPKSLDWNLLWQEAVGRFGKSPCLRLRDRWLSFRELDEESEHLASMLCTNPSWRRGALVLLPVKGEEFFTKLLAVWCAGGVAVPCKDDAVVGNARPEGSVDFIWGEGMPVAAGSRIGLPSSEWHAIYRTSGSTGEPRAIVRGWRQALYEAGHYAAVLGLRAGMDCTLLIHPTFGASTKHFLGCLLSGCRQSVPSVTGTSISGGDLLYATPSQIQARESELNSGRCFDQISLTGEPCSSKGWEVIRAISSPGAKCLNALGGTETGVLINSLSDIDSTGFEPGSLCGNGLPGKRLTVVGDDGAPLPSGTPGHLLVESEWIAEGYLEPAWEGDAGFHPFENKGTTRLFLTGDVVVEEEGRFRHLGRSGSMIKHRGEWLDTGPLRSALQGEGVDRFHLDRSGESVGLRVWIPMEHPDRELLKQIAAGLVKRLGESPLLPEMLLAITEFPLNAHGKTDLRELARLAGTDEVFSERISSRIRRIAEAIVSGEWDSLILKGALRIGDLELDSLSLHELLLEIERLMGNPISRWKITPATLLAEITVAGNDHAKAFTRLDAAVGAPVLLWMGDGVTGIRHELGKRVRILHWNVSAFPGAEGTEGVTSLRELSQRMIGMADSADLSGRIVIGGFSAGAVLAHEASLVLADRGTPPEGVLLLDPPDLDYRPIRSPWRWSRWRPSILCRLLRLLPAMFLDASGGRLRHFLAEETQRHVRERRRKLLRNYQPGTTSLPTVLATSASHHEGALRGFAHVSGKIGILPLGVENHTEVMSDPCARSLWMGSLAEWLFGSTPARP